ncbi:MAG: DUF1295 domain-containing protein [Pseudomonadota bacterium]
MSRWVVAGVGIPAAIGVAVAVAWAGSHSGVSFGGWPVMVLCALFAFGVQWIMFVHAWITHSEHYFDLTGSITYIVMVVAAVLLADAMDLRSLLLATLIVLWALRLGPFLFRRIKAAGEDRRFRSIRNSFPTFLMTWTLQGTWVFVTACAALAAITAERTVPLDGFLLVGAALWLIGIAFESVADAQKSAFNGRPENEGQFITEGLWAWSRHPNYFGEILLWSGIAVIAYPVLQGYQYLTLISPLFVFVLLRYISGIRMLDNRARKRWGNDPEYWGYRERTPMLIPRPPRL